jgi:hypothetical protein
MNTFKSLATKVALVAIPIAFLAIETAGRLHP